MEEKSSLKKILQKKILHSAILDGIIGVFVLGILSIITGSTIASATIEGILFVIIIFFSIFLTRKITWKREVKKLQSKKYKGLSELGFMLSDNLFYEGVYNEFLIRIIPSTIKEKNDREVEYDVIQVFYQSKSDGTNIDYEAEEIEYHLGNLSFFDNCVCFVPKDFLKPNFKYNLDGIVNILKREEYKQISKEELINSKEQNL
jgi:hypothetical protein